MLSALGKLGQPYGASSNPLVYVAKRQALT